MLDCKKLIINRASFRLEADFTLATGEHLAVLGASGAGKSTLLMALGGFEEIESGKISVGEQVCSDLPASQRPMAQLFQDNNLFPHLSAYKNVALGIAPNLRLSEAQKAAAYDALKRVGLEGYETRLPKDLSGGQQSRVALARVLVQQKPLILLDEPFSALGPALRAEMIDLAAEVADSNRSTLIMVTHDLSDVERFAKKVVWIDEGKCTSPQTWESFQAAPPETFKAYSGQ